MNTHLAMEKKRDVLEKKLDEDLQMEHNLKLQINQEFEELKHVEGLLERRLAEKHLQEQLNVEHWTPALIDYHIFRRQLKHHAR